MCVTIFLVQKCGHNYPADESIFQKIIDAIGGVTVQNETSFTSHDGYYFEQGKLDLDGEHALHYARERKAFKNGDFQRGQNQMKVIKAMVKKMTSPSILGNYASLMSGVSDSFRTSLSDDEISSLVKSQLKVLLEMNTHIHMQLNLLQL